MRIALWASVVFTAMTFSTLYIGPGLGVEANCVTLQTCGKTLMVTLKDIALSARYALAGLADARGETAARPNIRIDNS
jgi:hypothetical protein